MADEVSMAYIQEILPKTSCSKFTLQDNGTKFKNEQLMSVFNTLGLKGIYGNPYYPQGNGRIENVHNFIKHTIVKFTYSSQLEWDDALSLATYCYNIVPSVDGIESPFYLVHGQDPLEGRLSNLQNYCRYMGDQPGRLAVQELQRTWKLHAKLLAENRITKPAIDKKVTKVSDLKIGQLVLIKNHQKGPFHPTYIYDHQVAYIPNESTVLLTTADGKEKKCNIHHVKLVSSLDMTSVGHSSQVEIPTGASQQFQHSIQQNSSTSVGVHSSNHPNHSYNLWSKMKKP